MIDNQPARVLPSILHSAETRTSILHGLGLQVPPLPLYPVLSGHLACVGRSTDRLRKVRLLEVLAQAALDLSVDLHA